MPGIDPRFEASADFEPSPEDLAAWQSDNTPAPPQANPEEEEGSPEGETKESPEKPQVESPEDSTEEKPKQESRKKSEYSEKVAKRKESEHYFNEQHKQLRLREKTLKEREQALAKREQELEQKPEDWLKYAEQLEQYGDFDKAQQARHMAEQAKQQQAQRQTTEQQQAEFAAKWRANEQDILAQDPEFMKEGSYVREELVKLFNDPELGQAYRSHPDGIWAAYHRVRLQEAQELIPKLVKVAEYWKSEYDKLQKGNAPLTSAPKANLGSKSFNEMNEEEMEREIRKEIARSNG